MGNSRKINFQFTKKGTTDIVLSYFDLGKAHPLGGRSCSSQQSPFVNDKFHNS